MEGNSSEALNQSAVGTPAGADSKGSIEQAAGKESSPIVLDTVEKFVLHGHEWTPEELNKSILRQNDYTKKTQELAELRKQIEEQRESYARYEKNVDADIDAVLANPRLEAQFKKIYPKPFHAQLDLALKYGHRDEDADDSSEQVRLPREVVERLRRLDALEEKLEQIEEGSRKAQNEAADKYLEVITSKFSSKYQFAVEESVFNMAQAILEANRDNPRFQMTEGVWEKLWKQSHDRQKKRYDQIHNSQVSAQLRKGELSSDVAAGGAAPGRAPNNPKNLAEARKLMLQDMKRGKAR